MWRSSLRKGVVCTLILLDTYSARGICYAQSATLAPKSGPRFRSTDEGETMLRGMPLGFVGYESAAGEQLWYFYGRMDGFAAAKRDFETEIARATKVIEQTEIKDSDALGGKRAIVILPPEEGERRSAYAIIRTDGGHFREIRCYSLKVALDLEKFLSE